MNNQEVAPVAVFVYNRPDHTRATIEALKINTLAGKTSLYVYSDYPRDEVDVHGVNEVREYIKKINGFKEVNLISRESNFGLAKSIISGVTELVSEFGCVIVLEDDLIASPKFLEFMNEGLSHYRHNDKILSICGYMYPIKRKRQDKNADIVCLIPPHSWGWATWSDRWKIFNNSGSELKRELIFRGLHEKLNYYGPYNYKKMLNDQILGLNDSWFVRWYASSIISGKVSIYPRYSLIKNIGLDGSGVHCKKWFLDPFQVELYNSSIKYPDQKEVELTHDSRGLRAFRVKIIILRVLNFLMRAVAGEY
jgi:Glycosyl transferase family 2